MPENNTDPDYNDLDRILTSTEREVWGSYEDVVCRIKPAPEFASALESRMARMVRLTAPSLGAATAIPPWRSVTRFTPRSQSPNARGGFRLALVAVTLSAAMVILFVFAVARKAPGRTAAAVIADYLPAGKAHHLVIEHTYWNTTYSTGVQSPVQSPMTVTQEVWLANGDSGHVIMYSAFASDPASGYQGPKMWVTDDAVYDYDSSGISSGYVLKYRYNPSYANRYLPDPGTINDWSTSPGYRVLGHGILDGRPVVEIETDPSTVSTPATPSSADKSRMETVDHVWLDTTVFQMVKLYREQRTVSGPDSGMVSVHQYHLLSDEVLDSASLPHNFFVFTPPSGVHILDSADPIGNPLLTPTAGVK